MIRESEPGGLKTPGAPNTVGPVTLLPTKAGTTLSKKRFAVEKCNNELKICVKPKLDIKTK